MLYHNWLSAFLVSLEKVGPVSILFTTVSLVSCMVLDTLGIYQWNRLKIFPVWASSDFSSAKFREAKLRLKLQRLFGSICHLHITNGYLIGVCVYKCYIRNIWHYIEVHFPQLISGQNMAK